MSEDNVRANIVTVHVSGVERILNLAQVLFAHVLTSTSRVYVNEGASVPATFDIEGDFRNVVAGAGVAGAQDGPVFGAFTETGAASPVVINFNQVNRFISQSSLTFSKFGAVGAFTYTLLESPADVLGNMGKSLEDVGIFSANQTGNRLPAPVQGAATTAHSGGTVADATYFLKITAVNAAGETTGSNEVSIVVAGTIADTSTLTAHWTADTGAVTYNIYIGTGAGAENIVFTGATGTSHIFTALPVTSGTVPSTNTAAIANVQEFINVKNVTHQIPSGTNWTTLFTDTASVLYLESIKDFVGG